MSVFQGTSEESYNEMIANVEDMYSIEYNFHDILELHSAIVSHGCGKGAATNEIRRMFYSRVCEIIHEHVEENFVNDAQDDNELIQTFLLKWDELVKRTALIQTIFRAHREKEDDLALEGEHDLSCQARRIWRLRLADTLARDIGSALVRKIALERSGDTTVDRQLLRQVILIFRNMVKEDCTPIYDDEDELDPRLYEQIIEIPLLSLVRKEYAMVFATSRSIENRLDYVRMCLQLLDNEEERFASVNFGYIPYETGVKINEIARNALICGRQGLIYEEFMHLLQTDQIEALNVFYRLSIYVPEVCNQLRIDFERHVVAVGEAAIAKLQPIRENGAAEYVETSIAIYRNYKRIITEQLGDDKTYSNCLDRALSKFVNSNETTRKLKSQKAEEYLVRYCDQLLRQWAKHRPTDDQLHETLSGIALILRCLNEKDKFELLYRQRYAKRIAGAVTLPDSEEADMIALFQQVLHPNIVCQLETLNKDVLLSREYTDIFKAQSTQTSFTLNINIIQQNCWPLDGKSVTFNLPQELSTCVVEFSEFYKRNNPNRQLSWMHNHSRGELIYRTTSKTYVLELSTYQMYLLLLYNKRNSFTLEELEAITNWGLNVLTDNLDILIENDLILAPAGDVLNKSSELALNLNYRSIKRTVHLKEPAAKIETKDESETEESIRVTRRQRMEAAVVRTMKQHRALDVNTIIAKVAKATERDFTVNIDELKGVLKSLVKKDYIKKRAGKAQMYEYIA